MRQNQIEALSDARAAIKGRGLERSGQYWSNRYGTHHHNTVRSLIDRGYLQTYVKGEIAHITEAGEMALAQEIESMGKAGAREVEA